MLAIDTEGSRPAHLRASTHVTTADCAATLVRMGTQGWNRDEFFRWLDRQITLVDPPIADMQELSQRSGVSHSALSRWRSGSYQPSLRALSRLAQALDVPQEVVWARSGIVPISAGQVEVPDDEALIVQVIRGSALAADVQDKLIAVQLAELRRERDDRVRQVRQQIEIMEQS